MPLMAVGPDGLVPQDPEAARASARAAKPRGSLADAVRLKQGCVPCRKPAPPGALALRGYPDSWSGYGQILGWLGKGLDTLGVPVRFLGDLAGQPAFLPPDPWVAARMASGPAPGGWVLQCAVPGTVPVGGHPTAAFTMWESSRVGPEAVACLNRARVVVVPCRWNAEGFRASGVTAPIRVVPLGVAASEGYAPKPWPEGRPFTFGMAARMAHGGIRKGLNEGMAAFVRAFDAGQDVRLEVKVYPDCLERMAVPDDPRIDIITKPMTPPEMAEWCGGIDCLFVPSKGEGFGLHTIQALAVGRPVIAAVYSGTADFVTPDCCLPLEYTEEPAREFYHGIGNWCVPAEYSMVSQLQWAFAHPDEVRAMGSAGARRAAEFTWDRTARELAAVLREFGAIP